MNFSSILFFHGPRDAISKSKHKKNFKFVRKIIAEDCENYVRLKIEKQSADWD